MADEEQFRDGVVAWNAWRKNNPSERPDLRGGTFSHLNLIDSNLRNANLSNAVLVAAMLEGADLAGAKLTKANLSGAYLGRANLYKASLIRADLGGAKLYEANLGRAVLNEANLGGANCRDADLHEARLIGANLSGTKLCGANLRGANLTRCNVVEADLTGADLTGCRIYGLSAWRVKLEGAIQQDLVISKQGEPEITVDNVEVAQFIDLLLHNEKIRDVIDTIGRKAVLILGRFTPERKSVLDSLRRELRKHDYLPILFDFNKPASRDISETVSLLAHMARFVLADITDAKSIPQELAMIVPSLPSVPVQPLLLKGSHEYGMFEHFTRYPWVLETYQYSSPEDLIDSLADRVLRPAEARVAELRSPRRQIAES